jgi:hypothetical protein
MMALADVVCLPLAALYLCADCCAVGNDARRCPACASEQGLLNLANALDREVSRTINSLNESSH